MATTKKSKKSTRQKDLKPRKAAAKSVKGGRPNIYAPKVNLSLSKDAPYQ